MGLATAMIIGGIGTMMSAAGAYKQAQAQNQAADYNSAISMSNAQLAAEQEAQTKEKGEQEVKQIRLNLSKTEGENRAAFGAAGVSTGAGSPVDVAKSNAGEAERDVITTRYNAAQDARAFRIQSINHTNQANLYQSSKVNPWMSAFGTMVGGTSSLVSQYRSFKSA